MLQHTNNNKIRLNCLYKLGYEYGLIKPSIGISYSKKCLQLAESEKDLEYQLNAYNGLGNAYESLGNFDSAKYFHLQSFLIAKKINSPTKIALTIFNVALCLKQQGDYKQALASYLNALKILEKQKTYNPRIHYYLAELYLLTGDLEKAKFHSKLGFKKCLERNENYVGYTMNIVLAKCLLKVGQIDSARLLLKSVLIGLKKNTDLISTASCLAALGETYLIKGEVNTALEYFNEELELQKKSKNRNGIYLANINIAYCLAQLNPTSISEITEKLRDAKNNFIYLKGNRDVVLMAYEKLAKIYEKINHPMEALMQYKNYFELKDSILNEEKFKQINELQVKYEVAKKESDIKILQQQKVISSRKIDDQKIEIKKQLLLVTVLIVLIVLLFLAAFFYIKNYRLKERIARETAIRKAEETERNRISKDIHDEIGSGLSKIKFLTDKLAAEPNLTNTSFNNLQTISQTSHLLIENMRDLIWALNPDGTTIENLIARIREYSYDYLDDLNLKLVCNFPEEIPPLQITQAANHHIFMILKESLQNIIKHAGASEVKILINISSAFEMRIEDDGVGFKKLIQSDGHGLKNLEKRSGILKGTLVFHSAKDEGLQVVFKTELQNIVNTQITT